MPGQKFNAVQYVCKRLQHLVGATIVSVSAFQDDTCGLYDAWPVLEFELADGTRQRLMISRDREGNGPGALMVAP